ncbi:DUF1140 family protein [Planococcus versutus]|uniref:DUF1140 domain-containing protein n=1 Tax=Planococcus versutus TaxID=1302659 RepID=A0A1B1S5H0_9BACL|nr:DUF1140 family protein [Planococcus versutus]ANU28434.1 hypothetical protein I858_015700 [Planococcus versutus]
MSQQTNFTKLYVDLILKKIVANIQSHQKKKDAAVTTSLATGETGQGVRSSRHWKASAAMDLHYSEIQKGFSQMRELDELTQWSSKLHQDRFKFLGDKYIKVLHEYLTEHKRID